MTPPFRCQSTEYWGQKRNHPDCPDISDKQLDRREGKHGELMAVKTPLGWTVYGPTAEPAGDRVHVNFTHKDQERLNIQLERMYDEEFNEASVSK